MIDPPKITTPLRVEELTEAELREIQRRIWVATLKATIDRLKREDR